MQSKGEPLNQNQYKTRHEFEDEEGDEIELTEITYEVLKTYVDIDPISHELVFTHRVKISDGAMNIELWALGMHSQQDPEDPGDII
jgi:hypothetical protein